MIHLISPQWIADIVWTSQPRLLVQTWRKDLSDNNEKKRQFLASNHKKNKKKPFCLVSQIQSDLTWVGRLMRHSVSTAHSCYFTKQWLFRRRSAVQHNKTWLFIHVVHTGKVKESEKKNPSKCCSGSVLWFRVPFIFTPFYIQSQTPTQCWKSSIFLVNICPM